MADILEADESDDEFFGNQSDEDGGDFGVLGEREHKSQEQALETIGYLESYDETKETRLQEGFEAGYKETFDAAVRIGKLLGQTSIQQVERSPDKAQELSNDPSTIIAREVRSFLTRLESNEQSVTEVPESLQSLELSLEAQSEKLEK